MKRLLAAVVVAGALTVPLAGTASAEPDPVVGDIIADDDVICLWDNGGRWGGVCLTGLDPITRIVQHILNRYTGASFTL